MKVIAHRGLTSSAPENTIPAITAALQRGFSVEVDIHPTADGAFVASHDETLERVTGVKESIRNLTQEQVKHSTIRPDDGDDRTYEVPTLGAVLDAFTANAQQDAQLALHLKGHEWDMHATRLIDVLSKFNRNSSIDIFERTFVFDVTTEVATDLKAIDPSVRVGLSIGEPDYFPTDHHPTIYRYDDIRDLDCCDVVWADEWRGTLYTADLVERVRADDRPIFCVSPELHAGTNPSHPKCDQPADVWRQVLSYDVDGICTNFPTELIAIIS